MYTIAGWDRKNRRLLSANISAAFTKRATEHNDAIDPLSLLTLSKTSNSPRTKTDFLRRLKFPSTIPRLSSAYRTLGATLFCKYARWRVPRGIPTIDARGDVYLREIRLFIVLRKQYYTYSYW